MGFEPAASDPHGAGVGRRGQHRPAKLRPRNGTPAWNPGLPDTPFAPPAPLLERSQPYRAVAQGPQPFRGPPQPPSPALLARRAASPPPVWYLHLSHICKLLSCPRLVTAEPSAMDLAPLIFPPKSILHFPLIIPWLLSELSCCCLCLSFWNCSPSDSKWVSQGHGEHLRGGVGIFSAASPGLGA